MITWQRIMGLGPCSRWPKERVRRFVPEPVTAQEFLELDGVLPKDKLWVVLRKDFLSHKELLLFAPGCASRALRRMPEPDPRSLEAVKVARAVALGQLSEGDAADAAAAAYSAYSAAAAAAAAAERVWQLSYLMDLLKSSEGTDAR